MPDNFSTLVKEHHAFYEVSPYYVLLDERPLGLPATTRSVHAGFNVDVYGVRTEDNEPAMPPPDEYALGYFGLQKLAENISQRASDSCSLEVIPFPSTAIIDSRNHGQVEAMIRIQISHERGLNQPAGLSEQRALREVERELKGLGIVHR
ncbi:MAG TPA: hypothetical protein VLW25_11150 [Bryobacteraceae bacterium]|nr:hypothetical protein [Bryobacteraceae bacterium]